MGSITRAQNWLEAPIPDVGEHTGNLVERCRKHERPRHERLPFLARLIYCNRIAAAAHAEVDPTQERTATVL